jgi:HK97 family phage prohead protease
MIRFNADKSLITAQRGDEDDEEYARISGLAVPWDVVATVSDGQKIRFERGAFNVDQKAAKLIQNHDLGQLLGVVDNLDDAEAGLEFEAVLADTAAGRDAVALIKAGAYDAVSVGANPVKFTTDPEGVMSVTEAQLIELSLVSIGAYEEAVITEIAAEAPADADEQGEQDPEDHTDNTEQENLEMSEAKTEAQPIEAEATTPTYPIVYAAKPELPSAVEYISAILKGGHEFDAMRKRVQAAAPEIGTIDTPGILPTPILGPVYNNVIAFRPVVDAIGSRAMPGGGKVFIRPEVTTHTSIAQQAAEFDTLQSGTLVVTDNQVTKASFGGFVQISEQDLDWTDPAILSIVLDDLGRVYAQQTDNEAADALVAGATVTENFTVASINDPTEWARWFYAAAQGILSTSNGNLPNHVFVSPNIWAALGELTDSSDRPLFPQVGPMNAFGSMGPGTTEAVAFGLRVVVDRNFANDTLIAGDASGFEIYEQLKGAISVDVPETLSRTLAWRGYFATLMIDNQKFRKAVFV